MLFDSTMLCRVAADIERTLLGATVARVLQAAYDEVCIEVRNKAAKPQMLMSCNAEFGRVVLTDACEPMPGSADLAFGNALRKHLKGATLTGVRQINFDRIVELHFANCEGLGPQARRHLVVEIMGRHGNLVLVDSDGEILACARQVTERVNRYRQTMPGYEYVPPPGGEKLQPEVMTPAILRSRLQAPKQRGKALPLWEALRAEVSGGSETFLEEVCARAGLDRKERAEDVDAAGCERLATALHAITEEARQAGPGFLYTDPDEPGRGPLFAYPLALRSRLQWDAAQTDDLSEAVERLHGRLRSRQAMEQVRRRLEGIVTAALHKAASREQERRKQLDSAYGADEMRQRGELLLAQLHAIPAGADTARIVDYYADGTPEIEIPLDPKRSVQENAQALFNRYRKLKRVLDRVPPLLNEAAQERQYLEGVIDQIELADGPEELDEIETELASQGYARRPDTPAGRKQPPGREARPKLARFTSPDGYAILFGKTGLQNDEVIRQADNNDIWLHVKDGPGGHVVIRTGNKPDQVPESTLIIAAQRAALNSRQRRDSVVEVNYTLAKYLRKQRYARPGFVYYSEFKTIAVKPG